jgi:hypothetical protein
MANYMKPFKYFLIRTPIYGLIHRYRQQSSYRDWVIAGKPSPPHLLYKQHIIKEYAKQFALDVFIETGTYLGDMVDAVKQIFNEIYTIELSQELYLAAKKRFSRENHITVLYGDSGELLDQLLLKVDKPSFFWLDAHYSSGITVKSDLYTPINKELFSISQHPLTRNHVIFIDDARCYTGNKGYPELQLLKDWAFREGFEHFEVQNDIIRIFNPQA